VVCAVGLFASGAEDPSAVAAWDGAAPAPELASELAPALAAALPAVLSAIAAARPLQVAVRPPSLEQLFLDQYTGQEADDGGEPR